MLKSNVKFSYLESSDVENISENHDFLNGYSINNFMVGPDITDSKVGFIPQEEQISVCICYLCIASILLWSSSNLVTQFISDIIVLQRSGFDNKTQPSISTNSHSRSGSAALVCWKPVIIFMCSFSKPACE